MSMRSRAAVASLTIIATFIGCFVVVGYLVRGWHGALVYGGLAAAAWGLAAVLFVALYAAFTWVERGR